jgi:hypothetical protein
MPDKIIGIMAFLISKKLSLKKLFGSFKNVYFFEKEKGISVMILK